MNRWRNHLSTVSIMVSSLRISETIARTECLRTLNPRRRLSPLFLRGRARLTDGPRRECDGDIGARSSQYRRCSVGRMTITFAARPLTFALGAFVLTLGSACEAAGAEDLGPTVELKPGQEIAFSVAIADGHVTPGKARLLRS